MAFHLIVVAILGSVEKEFQTPFDPALFHLTAVAEVIF